MVREGRVLISSATDPDFGAGYYVTAYEVGAQVAAGFYPGTVITVNAGHGFESNDKLFVFSTSSTYYTTYRRVVSVTSTTLTLASTLSVSVGDILVNLGPDTGSSSMNWDGSGATVYTDSAYGTAATNSTVLCDANGKYRYWHQGIPRWELVRTSLGTQVHALYMDAATPAVDGPATSTDNAVARWNGATGDSIQDSAVIVSDAGAVTGITTLSTSGLATLASASVTGAATVGTTLAVTGASTLTGAVGCGAVTSTGNITSGGHLRGLKGTAALTGSTAITTAGYFLIDITNTSGSNTFTLTAPSSVDGQILILRVAAITAGDLSLADSGNVSLSAAWTTPGVGDTLTLVASGVVWYEIARSNN